MYYPQSKIISNQNTPGQEYVYKNNTDVIYVGYYHILATGKIFTGRNPRDGQLEELIPWDGAKQGDQLDLPPPQGGKIYKTTRYDDIRQKQNIKPPNAELIEPKYSEPAVQYPSFTRYFLKRTNNAIFTEVNQIDFNAIKIRNPEYNFGIYIPFELPWTTSGANIAETNQKITLLTEKRFKVYGLSKYITNYTEFSI